MTVTAAVALKLHKAFAARVAITATPAVEVVVVVEEGRIWRSTATALVVVVLVE